MAALHPGERIRIEDPSGVMTAAVVGDEIGSGGQGSVHRIEIEGPAGGDMVLKWYNDYYAQHFAAEQLQAIQDLLDIGSPSDRFLWPKALAFAPSNPSFGYVMHRRPDTFDSLALRLNELSYDAVITFALQICQALQELHTRGFAYRDINLKNFFVTPSSGAALICDTDNIGFERRSYMGVLGKDEFMAPEIVRRQAAPSSNTDRHSLAVLLFLLFVRWHPLEGRRTTGLLDQQATERAYGREPLFCFDPDADHNRPPDDAPHAELYWRWYPRAIRELFTRAFTSGLHDPQHGRVMESEWLEALVSLRDAMTTCAACGGLNWRDAHAAAVCRRPGCGAALDRGDELEIRLGPGRARQVVVAPGRSLYGYHLHTGYTDLEEIAAVVEHPDDPDDLGLLNTGSEVWQVRFADGVTDRVAPGEGLRLEAGIAVHAGNATICLVDAAKAQ